MEARISSISEGNRLILVLQVVLNMTELVMDGDEILLVDLGAHFDSKLFFYPPVIENFISL